MNYLKCIYQFFSKGVLGIKFMLFVSIGSFKFNVAGKILWFNDIIENIDSTLPAAPKRWPIDDFVELTNILCKQSRNSIKFNLICF